MSDDRTPKLQDYISDAHEKLLSDINTSIPARVLWFDPATRMIAAQPLIRASYVDESGNKVLENLPVVPNVPIVYPGGGGYEFSFPIVEGDKVLLVFSQASLDTWLSDGGIVDPGDDRRFHLTDAIAIPGLSDFKHATEIPIDRMIVGKKTGAQVHIKADGGIDFNPGNGGLAGVARIGDRVIIPTESLVTALTGFFVPMDPVMGLPGQAEGTVDTGSATVKAGD